MPEYLRVSTVLGYNSGLHKIDPYVLQKAAERGTKIHAICDALIDDMGIDYIEPQFEGYIESFNKWRIGKKFINKIPRLYCDEYLITGELDQLYEDTEGLVLVDFKTPQSESKTWSLQGSAYAHLCKKNGYNIVRIEFIQLLKNGQIAKTFVYKENFEMFLKCLEVYRFFLPHCDEDYFNDI